MILTAYEQQPKSKVIFVDEKVGAEVAVSSVIGGWKAHGIGCVSLAKAEKTVYPDTDELLAALKGKGLVLEPYSGEVEDLLTGRVFTYKPKNQVEADTFALNFQKANQLFKEECGQPFGKSGTQYAVVDMYSTSLTLYDPRRRSAFFVGSGWMLVELNGQTLVRLRDVASTRSRDLIPH